MPDMFYSCRLSSHSQVIALQTGQQIHSLQRDYPNFAVSASPSIAPPRQIGYR